MNEQEDISDFKTIVLEYQDRVYNTCLGFLRNEEDAEDVAQEVFMEVYRSIDSFKGDAMLSTWIYRIAVNKSLEEIRKRKRKKRWAMLTSFDPNIHDRKAVESIHPGVLIENKERAKVLFRAIDALPEQQKVAFTLFHVEGMDYETIAKTMDKSLSSVESLMHRAKVNLKKLLYQYYQQDKN